jgi:putative ABC transport system permease protein
MRLSEAIAVSLQGLRANRLRSLLTILGIMIGVAAVIVLVSIGTGTAAKANEQIESLGTNLIGIFQSRGNVAKSGRSQPLDDKDVRALQVATTKPRLLTVTPIKQGSAVLEYQNEVWRTSIVGSSPDYLAALHREVSAGRFFTEAEVRTSSKVVVLGADPLKKLFGPGTKAGALGQKVRIGRQIFTVSGLLTANGQQDDVVVMPISAARNYLIGGGNDDQVDQIVVQATSQAAVPEAMAKVTRVLLDQHRITDPEQKDFDVRSNLELLQKFSEQSQVFSLFLIAIAAISLLVGGIGIMNIMLVTVTERTREIGIRKAIGARRKAILKQFLIESTVLAGIGGALGVAIGVGLSLIGEVFQIGIGSIPPPQLSSWPVVAAFSVSLAIGLFFGAYPARRAASLRPIDALRYE